MYHAFAGKRVLLLQGPVGPFFRRLAADLVDNGATVTKVNFNAADGLYYLGRPAIAFRGRPQKWPAFVEDLLRRRKIDSIFLFGDGRSYHRRAIEVANKLGVRVYVFEEGYLRPHYVTLEVGGVNGRSTMPRDPAAFRQANPVQLQPTAPVDNTFLPFALYSGFYAIAYTFFRWSYPFSQHHRDLNAFRQAYYWLRAGWRKVIYQRREQHYLEPLQARWSGRFFLFPLQVHHDAQWQHASFADSESLIDAVVRSFAAKADPDHLLVIKHHPLDRGYRDYTTLIEELTQQHGLAGRLLYVHDLHLPTLLKHARGTVVMNSTVGLSSIFHHTPVKALGKAVYDLPGLTCQRSLEEFWRDPGQIDEELYRDFQSWLRVNNQANGSFYRRLRGVGNKAGIRWFAATPHSGAACQRGDWTPSAAGEISDNLGRDGHGRAAPQLERGTV